MCLHKEKMNYIQNVENAGAVNQMVYWFKICLKIYVYYDYNFFPDISCFDGFLPPPSWGLKQWKNALFRPKTLFCVWERLLKKWPLFRRGPHENETKGGCQKGDVPPSVLGVERAVVSLIAEKILDMWQAKNGLKSILRWRVTNAESLLLYLIAEVAALWNQFWCKKNNAK
jgi:hypothetical protein